MSGTLLRRDFLRVSAAAGGGLLLAFRWLPSARASEAPDAAAAAADFAPNAWVRIAPDGRVTVLINKAEMGQGVSTSLSMLLAEELDADWKMVGFELAPAGKDYVDPTMHMQVTGGSSSVANMSGPLRQAGATARAMLVAAAAKGWGVPEAQCITDSGTVIHAPSSRSRGYGELAVEAAVLPVPQDVPLKDPALYRLLGRPTPRLDTPDKVFGRATFALDVRRPGMLVAVVARSPVFGGKLKSFDDSAARAVPGVKQVVAIGSGVAVLASGFWAARRGRDALAVEWDLGPGATLSTDALREEYRQKAQTPGAVAWSVGDAASALAGAARTLTAEFELPYLAHATMEPLNAVAEVRADGTEVWAGSQFQTVDQAAAAQAAGCRPDQVTFHSTFLGGGFGRRANPTSDYVVEAVQCSKAAGVPVQLVWTREDDLHGGYYRPLWHARIAAGLDASGAITAWQHTIVGQSITAGTPFEPYTIKNGIDSTSVEGAIELPYAIPNAQVDLHTTQVPVTTLWWRSVGHTHTAFVVESFLDDLAHETGTDPLELRRRLLAAQPRWLGVLNLAAAKAGWGSPAPPGRARGLAVHHSFKTWVAHVAEVSLLEGVPRVHRVTSAVDCGRVVNPDGVKAQVEGAVGFGLTALLYSAITIQDGRVQQSNFHDYRMLRIHEMPEVEVHLVESSEPSTGIGEPGVPPVAPAVCNALFALTGKRIRRLPLRPEDLRA
ncbi:MAG TPA: xanthine dehydrogenase family protein molybdopterin-binding subunit [Planctomycetota bacterium]|nr:xanthine dehydrogenase family protein molybdopterin-binding subunit [Planctomycetota bacterium]